MARATRDNLHSRLVTFLKITLPLVALGILSTLFLFSDGINPEDAIPYADVDIADRLAQPRVTEAAYSGVTDDGSALTLQVAEARTGAQGTEDGASARGLMGRLETPDGALTEIAAGMARLDQTARQIIMSGGIELITSAGVVAQAEGLAISLDITNVESTGKVSASGPFGQLTADHLHLTAQAGTAKSYVLVFSGDIRLIYQPKK